MVDDFGTEANGEKRFPVDFEPLRKVVMVGAVTEHDGSLSLTDASLLRSTLDPLRKNGIPVADDDQVEIEVMNKAVAFGERDFLEEDGIEADIVVLCNIPHQTSEQDYLRGKALTSGIRTYVEEAHHELSPYHWDEGIWRAKIQETGAKVIVSSGVDSMPLEDVTPSGFVHANRLQSYPGGPDFLMDFDFVYQLPFSRWGVDNEALKHFSTQTQLDHYNNPALEEHYGQD